MIKDVIIHYGGCVGEQPGENEIAGNLHTQVQALYQDAIRGGADPHTVAEVLMHGAREVLADGVEFRFVVDKILAHYGIEPRR
jgi:hypothetical protein